MRCRACHLHTHWHVNGFAKGSLCNRGFQQMCHHTRMDTEVKRKFISAINVRQLTLCLCMHIYHTTQYAADILPPSPSVLLQGVRLGMCACLMFPVWRDALWQAEASLGATCPSLLMPLTPPCPLDPHTTQRRQPSKHQWCWAHPLTRGSHWLTSDASPMLSPSFQSMAFVWVLGWVPLSTFLRHLTLNPN